MTAINTIARRGVTLLELLLVLSLLVIVAALVFPALGGTFAGRSLHSAAEQVRAEWARARNRAMLSGETQAFLFLPETGRYRIEPHVPAEAGPATEGFGASADESSTMPWRDGRLPEEIAFLPPEAGSARTATFGATARAGEGWSPPILFYADGTSMTVQVSLVGRRGRAISVGLRGLTGQSQMGELTIVDEKKLQ